MCRAHINWYNMFPELGEELIKKKKKSKQRQKGKRKAKIQFHGL